MLAEFDRQNKNYFLYAGSLIGQQLLGDILPWDDDIDILMVCPIRQSANRSVLYQAANSLMKVFDPAISPNIKDQLYSFPFLDLAPMKIEEEQVKHEKRIRGCRSISA